VDGGDRNEINADELKTYELRRMLKIKTDGAKHIIKKNTCSW
jgi:hypothetical protein